MMKIKELLISILIMSVVPTAAWAQNEMSVEEELDSTYTEIHYRMMQFQEELMQIGAVSGFRMDIDTDMPLTDQLLDAISLRLRAISRAVNSFSSRWDAYSQAQQVYIADKAETFIWRQDKIYRKLYKQAVQFSLSPKLAAKLEKVKAEEQAVFADIETNYSQAKTAVESFPGLNLRMEAIDNKYFQLQSVSAKIQTMEYKPFIQRIKDYLIGLAAVAILLMFFNLLNAKIKTQEDERHDGWSA